MFESNANKAELRQGDIVIGPYFPIMKGRDLWIPASEVGNPIGASVTLRVPAETQEMAGWQRVRCNMEVIRPYCMVISQCCDIEARGQNGGRRLPASFLVAPLLPISPNVRSSEKWELLVANELGHWIGRFYVSAQEPLPTDYWVDFARVFPLPKAEYDQVLGNKLLQLTHDARMRLKLKLNEHFCRLTEEEQEIEGSRLLQPSE